MTGSSQDFGVLQLMLLFISRCMAASNSRQCRLLFCVPDVFQVSRLFGIQNSRYKWKEDWWVFPLQSLKAKQGMASFTQTKKSSLNPCLHLLNKLLIIAAAAQEAAPQNPEFKMRCGASLCWGSYWSSHWVDLLVLMLP